MWRDEDYEQAGLGNSLILSYIILCYHLPNPVGQINDSKKIVSNIIKVFVSYAQNVDFAYICHIVIYINIGKILFIPALQTDNKENKREYVVKKKEGI